VTRSERGSKLAGGTAAQATATESRGEHGGGFVIDPCRELGRRVSRCHRRPLGGYRRSLACSTTLAVRFAAARFAPAVRYVG
jgi:hypothetical protein